MTEIKLCKDCKHFDEFKCKRNYMTKIPDYIKGGEKMNTEMLFAYKEREKNACGSEGKFWEKK